MMLALKHAETKAICLCQQTTKAMDVAFKLNSWMYVEKLAEMQKELLQLKAEIQSRLKRI